ncbi:MAG TPA: hypothetical protein VGK49_08290, partial [Ilumatobacteraceae bacterium]
ASGSVDAPERVVRMADACAQSGDVIVSGVGKALARRLDPEAHPTEPALPAGWQRVVEQITADPS